MCAWAGRNLPYPLKLAMKANTGNAQALRLRYTACMKQRHTTTSPSGDDAASNSTSMPRKKRLAIVGSLRGCAFLSGYGLGMLGAVPIVLGMTIAYGPLSIVLVTAGIICFLVGCIVAVRALFRPGFFRRLEDELARAQEKQSPTPPSSSAW